MSVLVYGPELFTVGADISFPAYDASWVLHDSTSVNGTVMAATDDLRSNGTSQGARNRWTGTVGLNHTIKADIKFGANNTSTFAGLVARTQTPLGSDRTQYLAQWTASGNIIFLLRVIGSSYTTVDSFGAVAINTTYNNCYIKVLGVGATVTIEYGDDTNGVRTFNDSTGQRIITGKVGTDIFEGGGAAALNSAIDNLRIYDDDGMAGTSAVVFGQSATLSGIGTTTKPSRVHKEEKRRGIDWNVPFEEPKEELKILEQRIETIKEEILVEKEQASYTPNLYALDQISDRIDILLATLDSLLKQQEKLKTILTSSKNRESFKKWLIEQEKEQNRLAILEYAKKIDLQEKKLAKTQQILDIVDLFDEDNYEQIVTYKLVKRTK